MFLPAPRSLSVSLFLFRVACLHYLLVTFSSTSSKSYQRVYLIALGSCRLPSNRISYLGLSRGSLRAEFYRVLAFAGSKTFPTPLFTFFPSPTCSLRPLQPAPILLINKHGVHENPIRKKISPFPRVFLVVVAPSPTFSFPRCCGTSVGATAHGPDNSRVEGSSSIEELFVILLNGEGIHFGVSAMRTATFESCCLANPSYSITGNGSSNGRLGEPLSTERKQLTT